MSSKSPPPSPRRYCSWWTRPSSISCRQLQLLTRPPAPTSPAQSRAAAAAADREPPRSARAPRPPARRPPWPSPSPARRVSTRVRCVSIFLDKNRRYIGKYQSKRPPKRTQRTPHRLRLGSPLQLLQLALREAQCFLELVAAHARLTLRRVSLAQLLPQPRLRLPCLRARRLELLAQPCRLLTLRRTTMRARTVCSGAWFDH
jgi:hypothetical protein